MMTAPRLTPSLTWKAVYKMWTGLAMAIIITSGCRATSNTVVTEPTTSDLSGLKGKYYQVLLTPANRSGSLMTFVVCPNKTPESMASRLNSAVNAVGSMITSDDSSEELSSGVYSSDQLKDYTVEQSLRHLCVSAFVDKEGQPITFSTRTLQNSDLLNTPKHLTSYGSSSNYVHLINQYRLVTLASGGMGAFVILSRVGKQAGNLKARLPVIIAAPFLYGAGVLSGEKLRNRNLGMAKNCVEALSNIQETSNQTPSQYSEVFAKFQEAVRNECSSLLTDFWVQDTPHVTLTSSFQELISTDPNNIESVTTRIPHILPILGKFVMDVNWTAKEVAYHCLPKYTMHDYVNQQEPLCIPLRRSWNTGNPYMYKKPTNMEGKHMR